MASASNYAPPIAGIVSGANANRIGFTIAFADVQGTVPAILVDVRMNNKGIRGMVRTCTQRNIHLRPCVAGALAEVPTQDWLEESVRQTGCATFEAIASIEHLEYLTGHPSVVSWRYIDKTARSVDARAAGSGAIKGK